jgi:hypothetical protein
MSSREITIRGLTIDGHQVCSVCDPKTVVDVLNRFVDRAQFRIGGGEDTQLEQGTPGGAQTAVQKSVERKESDTALINDRTSEVPALEMITYNDNTKWGRARQLYQFAGVATSASYSIALVPTGLGLTDASGAPGLSTDDASATLTDLGSSTSGVGSSGSGGSGGHGLLGAVGGALLAVARGIRLLFTNPREALLVLTGWGLLSLPFVLGRRRRLLGDVSSSR